MLFSSTRNINFGPQRNIIELTLGQSKVGLPISYNSSSFGYPDPLIQESLHRKAMTRNYHLSRGVFLSFLPFMEFVLFLFP
jgi:hypothetical protein